MRRMFYGVESESLKSKKILDNVPKRLTPKHLWIRNNITTNINYNLNFVTLSVVLPSLFAISLTLFSADLGIIKSLLGTWSLDPNPTDIRNPKYPESAKNSKIGQNWFKYVQKVWKFFQKAYSWQKSSTNIQNPTS